MVFESIDGERFYFNTAGIASVRIMPTGEKIASVTLKCGGDEYEATISAKTADVLWKELEAIQ